jgi:formate hydrogenlyase subunit 3/multisubunit Na+/H+ antiporter MnhD subunit
MSDTLLAASVAVPVLSAATALAVARRPRLATAIAVTGAVAGGICAVVAAVPVLAGGGLVAVELPFGFATEPVVLGLDPLSALFLALIGVLGAPAALFGLGYLGGRHGSSPASARAHAGVGLLLASLVLVVTARNGLVFLVAWEAMTISAYLLVVFDHESADVRAAGLCYLVASHIAYACILAFFAGLGHHAGSLDFAAMTASGASLSLPAAAGLFALALVGFGTKAGIVPFHVWLPRAHPAAPSHVSALMSGLLIKTGVYALLRALQFVGPPRVALGIVLVVTGGASAVYGIAFAVGQRDLKRALAYSSIENVGLIVLGIGLVQMAAALGEPRIALVAGVGALVHLVHHVLMKGGLFLGAGAVVHATGTRDVEKLGGLMRRMPRTAAAFLACSAAISGLPPLCGFVGEWLLLTAAVLAATRFAVAPAVVAVLAVLAIVVAGALAAASFLRLFTVVFLGTPRSDQARDAHAGGALLALPPLALAVCCLVLGLFPSAVISLVERAAAGIAGVPFGAGAANDPAVAPILHVGICGLVLVALVSVLAWLRRSVGGPREGAPVPTWGCGYAGPGGRLQYTASSFAQPLVQALSGILAPRTSVRRAEGAFPTGVSVRVEVPDRIEERVFERLLRAAADRMATVRRFQDGRVTRYLMFIVGGLVAGLGWAVASRWMLGT